MEKVNVVGPGLRSGINTDYVLKWKWSKTWQTQVYKPTQGKTAGSHGVHQEKGLPAEARAADVGYLAWSVCQGLSRNLVGWAGGSKQSEQWMRPGKKGTKVGGPLWNSFPLAWEKPWRDSSKRTVSSGADCQGISVAAAWRTGGKTAKMGDGRPGRTDPDNL